MLLLVSISDWTFWKKAKTGCEHVMEHFRYNCLASPFNMWMIEIFKCSGYEKKVCSKASEIRIARELMQEDS